MDKIDWICTDITCLIYIGFLLITITTKIFFIFALFTLHLLQKSQLVVAIFFYYDIIVYYTPNQDDSS